ncbi:hypothetical protein BH18THE2_BH18THE2_08580 [soil metagenome]
MLDALHKRFKILFGIATVTASVGTKKNHLRMP